MGKELQMARAEEKGQSMLLAISGSRTLITTSSRGNQRTKAVATSKGNDGRKTKGTKAKSQGSSKTKRANARSFGQRAGRGRDNKDWESDRGYEGEDAPPRRSAQELGITHPGSYCDEVRKVPHFWVGRENIDGGTLFQCKLCGDYLWQPMSSPDAFRLGDLMKKHGSSDGYCRFLNRHRAAKIMIAKLQDLDRIEVEMEDKREFARIADKILGEREYDRKEEA